MKASQQSGRRENGAWPDRVVLLVFHLRLCRTAPVLLFFSLKADQRKAAILPQLNYLVEIRAGAMEGRVGAARPGTFPDYCSMLSNISATWLILREVQQQLYQFIELIGSMRL